MAAGAAFAQEVRVSEAPSARPAPLMLAPEGSDAHGLSVDSHDYVTVAAWSESESTERSRIRFVTLRDRRLPRGLTSPQTVTLDATPSGRNEDVIVRIDESTRTPGFAWINTDGETWSLWYAYGWAGGARDHQEVIYASENPMELPSLGFDSKGRPYIAWSEIRGGDSEVYVAYQPAEDGWVVETLTANERPYDLLPQVFGGRDSADVYWYALESESFMPRKATLSATGIQRSRPESLSGIPTDWLPVLFRTAPSPVPGAFWLRPTSNGQVVERLPSTAGLRSVEEPFSEAPRVQLRAAISHSELSPMVCVVPAGNREWTLLAEDPSNGMIEFPVAESCVPVISQSANALHLLWYNDATEGGDGSLWYSRHSSASTE